MVREENWSVSTWAYFVYFRFIWIVKFDTVSAATSYMHSLHVNLIMQTIVKSLRHYSGLRVSSIRHD